jgi:hypothetical protein
VPPFEKTINSERTCRRHDKRATAKVAGLDIALDSVAKAAIADLIAVDNALTVISYE